MVYKDTKSKVELEGSESEWLSQETGIGQGCPLSPYLFLIVMSVMFHDIHDGDFLNLAKHRVIGTKVDEILFADDTICISTCTLTINAFLKAIEEEGIKYGMKLNKNKCELITTHPNADVKYQDGTQNKKTNKTTYLGCEIGIKTTNKEELSKRFANTMATMKKLDIFWGHSNCSTAIKIHTADAVLRSKLLYGFESSQLIPSILNGEWLCFIITL